MKKDVLIIILLLLTLYSCNIDNENDNGNEWKDISINTDFDLQEVLMINEKVGFVVGSNQVSAYPSQVTAGNFNIDSTMINIDGSSYINYKWDVIDSISSNPFVFKTINGGLSWDAVYLPLSDLLDISFINETIGFALFPSGLYRTLNGGVSWIKIMPNIAIASNVLFCKAFMRMRFINANEGFLYNNNFNQGKFLVSVNIATKSWKILDCSSDRRINGIIDKIEYPRFSSDTLFLKSNSSFYSSIDKGANWQLLHENFIFDDTYMVNNRIGFANFGSSLAKTSDGGKTWTTITNAAGSDFRKIIALDENNIYGIDYQCIYKSIDGGFTFSKMTKQASDINDISFPSQKIGYAVGNGGKVFKYIKEK